jgi:hypothetical protein
MTNTKAPDILSGARSGALRLGSLPGSFRTDLASPRPSSGRVSAAFRASGVYLFGELRVGAPVLPAAPHRVLIIPCTSFHYYYSSP